MYMIRYVSNVYMIRYVRYIYMLYIDRPSLYVLYMLDCLIHIRLYILYMLDCLSYKIINILYMYLRLYNELWNL